MRWLLFGWWQHFEWVINLKFSEPSESLKWPREQGKEALGPAPKDPWEELSLLRFSSAPDLDGSAVEIEGWGGAFQFPRASPT